MPTNKPNSYSSLRVSQLQNKPIKEIITLLIKLELLAAFQEDYCMKILNSNDLSTAKAYAKKIHEKNVVDKQAIELFKSLNIKKR